MGLSRPSECTLSLCISDTGPGITPERIETIFEWFGSTKESGLGVGLSIYRMIVEAHHGTIWVESAKHGTCFCFTVPAWREDKEGEGLIYMENADV